MCLPRRAIKISLSNAKTRVKNYRDDESGSLIAFSLYIFFAMIVFGGLAVDLMIYENERTHVQNSTDRAVLAAANLNQTVDAELVVVDYLAKVGIVIDPDDVHVVEVGTAPVITGRQVSVNVQGNYDTMLMNLVGVDTLPFSATSEAEEGINDIEVSLVLDVSGSMGRNNRLPRLKTAAKDFVDGILEGAIDDRVSVSLIPYSTQVSAGADLLGLMNTSYSHGYSNCVNFQNDSMFLTTAMDHTVALEQTVAFDIWRSYKYGRGLRTPICRTEAYMHILPWSNNATTITDQIEDFEAEGNTSIDVAFKWGAALLDPSMHDQLVDLEDGGADIDPVFLVRPHAYSDGVEFADGLKFIVVMTDGINTEQYYMKDDYKIGDAHRPGRPNSFYWLDPNTNSVWMASEEPYDRDGDDIDDEIWYNLSEPNRYDDDKWDNIGPGDDKIKLSWLDFWAKITVSRYAYAEYHQTSPWDSDVYYDNREEPYTYVSRTAKDTRLNNVCSAAKNQGVIVFTIGFEVTDHSADVMSACASTPNHFYRVEGLEIEYAFASIKNQINKLKLTQ